MDTRLAKLDNGMQIDDPEIVNILERITRHVYAAGRLLYFSGSSVIFGSKSFHLARACDLTDRLAEKVGNRFDATKVLLETLKQSGIVVRAYTESQWEVNLPLDRLVAFLMGEICHNTFTEAFIEYFSVDNCPKILDEASREEARKTLAGVYRAIASVGGDPASLNLVD